MSAPALYIGSTSPYAGKNTIGIGIGLRLQKDGVNLAYMKPVGPLPYEQNGLRGDEDAAYVQDVLGLDAPPDQVTPVLVTQDFKVRAFSGQLEDSDKMLDRIREAGKKLSQGRDLLIMGGSGNMLSGRYCGLDALTIIKKLNLKTIIVDRVERAVKYDALLALKDLLGDHLLGVVLNAVPTELMSEAESIVCPFLERNQLKVLGLLPHNPLMGAVCVDMLCEGLGGRILTARHNAASTVESFLIGTMQVENFMTYFRRLSSPAVIVGGDRADIQLVAIEGACACLILTGNLYPNDIIIARADKLGVPIIMTRDDTYTAAGKIEQMLGRCKLRDPGKISQAAHLVSSKLDFAAIRAGLGI
ncbi:MAG: AAA family ATPase [Deltaproteobacteria bacterium]|jgi:BioD-like phosphotransacetylase family protein|nr:AAA family ATPase [Deltaproteobacteria bacterium]